MSWKVRSIFMDHMVRVPLFQETFTTYYNTHNYTYYYINIIYTYHILPLIQSLTSTDKPQVVEVLNFHQAIESPRPHGTGMAYAHDGRSDAPQ